MKKILTILLSVAMVLCMMPGMAWAENEELEPSVPEGETPQEITYVAQVGETPYKTLEDALTAVKTSNEKNITILTNLADIGAINLPEGTIFDGNGKTISGESSLKINASGGEIKNVIFEDIHRNDNKLSPIYGAGLTGKATIVGCTFGNFDWDVIQITPKEGAEIEIKGNIFKPTSSGINSRRYVHIQSSGVVEFSAIVTDNIMYSVDLQETPLEVYYFANAEKINLTGNYIENPTKTCISSDTQGSNANDMIIPLRSKPDVDVDDFYPVAKVKDNIWNVAFFATLKAATDYAVDLSPITLLQDSVVNEQLDLSSKSIDMNGKIITLYNGASIKSDKLLTNLVAQSGYDLIESVDETKLYTYTVEQRYTPPTGGGSVTPTDPVTNIGTSDTDNATTNADLSKDTTSKTETTTDTKPDGTTTTTTTTTVSNETANKIVDKAVEHQSAEVVLDTTTKAVTTAPEAGDKTEVVLPAETMQTLAEKTTADVTIKSDVAEVTLDAKAVEAVAEQTAASKTETVTLVVENTKNEADEMHFELTLVTESGKVSDFGGGKARVTVSLNPALKAVENLICVYIDDNGVYHKVEGTKNADGTYTFVTGHFSSYAIMAADEADKVLEAQKTDRLIAGVQATTIKASSTAAPGYIRVKWNKSYGYKMDYFEVYKAKSKAELKASTKPYFETKSGTWKSYKNAKGLKKGTKYFYRVRGVREINGQKYYTEFSTMAYRYAK